MPYNEPLPPPPGRVYGDGADAASSTYRAELLDNGDGTLTIKPIAGFTGNATFSEPSRVKARLRACHAMASDGAGISNVDLSNVSSPPKFIFNKTTGQVTMGFPGLNHVQNLGAIEALADSIEALGY